LKIISKKSILLSIVILCILSIGYAFFAEFIKHIMPCTLCIIERTTIFVITLLSLLSYLLIKNKIVTRVCSILSIMLSIFAIKVAMHHEWLIHLPPDKQPQTCGMPLKVIYQQLPLNNFIRLILQGDNECSIIIWKVFGIDAPIAVIILLVVIISGLILSLIKK
jgi:disulfide bond formation protein DsbB